MTGSFLLLKRKGDGGAKEKRGEEEEESSGIRGGEAEAAVRHPRCSGKECCRYTSHLHRKQSRDHKHHIVDLFPRTVQEMSGGRRIRSWALSKGRSQAVGGCGGAAAVQTPHKLGPGGPASLAAPGATAVPKTGPEIMKTITHLPSRHPDDSFKRGQIVGFVEAADSSLSGPTAFLYLFPNHWKFLVSK